MKAMYQKPEIEMLGADLEQMIAASVEGGFSMGEAPETSATSGNLSRRSLWDGDDQDGEDF